jgi:hypothetical protein
LTRSRGVWWGSLLFGGAAILLFALSQFRG